MLICYPCFLLVISVIIIEYLCFIYVLTFLIKKLAIKKIYYILR